MSFIFLWLYYL